VSMYSTTSDFILMLHLDLFVFVFLYFSVFFVSISLKYGINSKLDGIYNRSPNTVSVV
jgi:hypothetical protein